MIRYKTALKFILSALVILISALSCNDNTGTLADFGNPPEPGKCFYASEGVETYLNWAAENYPEISSLRIIGQSVNGLDIYALEISDNPGRPEAEPVIFLGAAIHGHEQAGTGVSLKLIEYLLIGYAAEEPDAVNIIDNYKVHIIPVINPDGLELSQRYNENGIDLNRNFGYNWNEEENNNGNSAFDQPESRAIRDDFLKKEYNLALNLHTASSNSGMGIYGPWDAIPSGQPDFISSYLPNYGLIESIGESYSDTVAASSGYPYNHFFHYQEGADWYVLYGSLNDWAMGKKGAICYSIELYGKQNYSRQDASLVEDIWNANKQAIVDIIKTSSMGSGGRLLDGDGEAVAGASIVLKDTTTASRTFSALPYNSLLGVTDENGYFRFITAEGQYHINFTADTFSFGTNISVDSSGNTSFDDLNWEFYPDYRL